ncbi:MAG: S4 domain-containing protein, partial [Syntrophobacteraceae bacterium]
MTTDSRIRRPSSGFGSVFRWCEPTGVGGSRLDLAVSNQLKVCLEEAAALIDFGSVYVEGRVERDPSRMLTGGEEIVANVPSYGTRKYYELDPARIIYRDKFILAYDK